ncbi:hypothetical protein LTR85_008227 [Meristemomyces frigidus]|nr:hypothetical protein LTR85_008227 [Meristemomyces frigidus]
MKFTARLARLAAPFNDHPLAASPLALAACGFVALYLAAIYCVRSISSRDPGSWFFDPSTAYNHQYTDVRQRQAEAFVAAADTLPPFHRKGDFDTAAALCVGIPSIAREGVRYLRTTVGSLLEGMTQEERDGMHLIVFIPHTDPTVHPAYHEAWLAKLADDVLLYNLTESQLDHVAALELELGLMREKGLFDNTNLL